MELQIKKWGNSLGLRIPQAIAKHINIRDGSKINVVLKKNRIELTPVDPQKYDLTNLISSISEANLHNEIPAGEAQGKEIW